MSAAAVLVLLAAALPVATPDPIPPATVSEQLTFPVLDITGTVQSIVARDGAPIGAAVQGLSFPEASPDGAVESVGGRRFRLSSDVLFVVDSADLSERAVSDLRDIAARLREGGVAEVAVVGYTDSQGADDYNIGLSQRRADAVQRALSSALGSGVAVTASGRGEAEPIADNTTAEGRSLNRRVTITAT